MKVTKSLALFAVMCGSAMAASVSFNLGTDTGAALADDTALDSTYTLYLGTYTGGALDSTATFADINANFDTLTSIAFATGDAAGYNGYAIINSTNYTDGDGFSGDGIYAFISDGANQNALITGFGTFPADGDVPNFINTGISSSNAAGLTYLLGSYDAGSPNLIGSGGNVILNDAIPEPSIMLLGSLGIIGLLRRRRG